MSSPATQSSSSPATSKKKTTKYYMDPALIRARVGCDVKPTNPLLQFIPECKNIDEFNAFTRTETYRKLMDFRNPIPDFKVDPSLEKQLYRGQNPGRFREIKDYPLYANLSRKRFFYKATWAFVFVGTVWAVHNEYFTDKSLF